MRAGSGASGCTSFPGLTPMIEFVIRVGELTLKGSNRSFFERQLMRNIKRGLKGSDARVRHRAGRFYLDVPVEWAERAESLLSATAGVVGFARTHRCDKSIESIVCAAISVAESHGAEDKPFRFKIRAKRSDKAFSHSSHEIEVAVGDALGRRFPLLSVDLTSPDLLIRVEIRESAYVFGNDIPGPGGLPVGSAGRGVLLLSGGIDSPVAGYLMARRGLKLDAVYFDSYPYTSHDTRKKVETLADTLADINMGITLFTVPFTDICVRISERAHPEYTTVLMRACMMEVASAIAAERRALGIVTGDSLSQVASQTVENLRCTDSHAAVPVYRPLIGFDKQETIRIARNIGTYETSIEPYPDCCTVFRPDTPVIRPSLDSVESQFDRLDIAPHIDRAVGAREPRWSEPGVQRNPGYRTVDT